MPRPEVTAHLAAVSKLVAATGDKGFTEMPGYYLDVMGLYDRCRSMLDAVRTLLAAGRSHEAAVLAGPMFVDSLILAELASVDGSRRTELILGLALQGVADSEPIILASSEPDGEVERIQAVLADRRATLAVAASELGVEAREWCARSDVEELAKRHGRGEEYVDKLISDQFFNGSSLAIAQRYSPADEPKEVFVGGPHANVEDWSDGTGLFATSSMLHGLRAASSIFGWDEPSEVGELFAETERLKELAGVEVDDADPGGARTVAPELLAIEDPSEVETRRVVVVMSARSDALWRETDAPLTVNDFPTAVGKVTIKFRTAFFEEGLESTVPRELWVEAVGDESNSTFLEVISAYANAASSFIPVIAVCTNAYVDDPQPKIAFDNAPGKHAHDFFQSFIPAPRGSIPLPGRRVPTESVVAVLQALLALPAGSRSDRLRRAMGHYALALSHWLRGQETLALAFLFIGMETLVPVALDRECARLGVTPENLMETWDIPPEDPPAVRRNTLNGLVRQRLLFRGDSALAATAKGASDGFEHGYLDFGEIRDLAVSARDETGRLLRQAIFEYADVPPDHTEKLLSPPFDIPLHSFITRYIWGTILGETDDLAPEDNAYPSLEWRSKLKTYKRNEDGTVTMTPEETPTVRFAEGLAFRPRRYEAWAAEGIRTSSETPHAPDPSPPAGASEELPPLTS